MNENLVEYPIIEVERKTGKETFSIAGKSLPMNLYGFWQWAVSDLVSNAMRGILAEYIVANALGLVHGLRAEWDAFDLITENKIKIEVKSAAYLQTWHQLRLSSIKFGIQPTNGWDASTNTVSVERKRQADIYIFCLLAHKEQDSLDPLNLDQWQFYVLPATVLDENCPTQKSISLSSLLKLHPTICKYEEIAISVAEIAGFEGD